MSKITYTNKSTLNPQPSIANENKVTSNDMNEIKSVVNENDDNIGNLSNLKTTTKTSVVDSINELVDTQLYSTTEVKTNKVWIDGKPIYRKVITGTLPAISGSGSVDTNIAHNISNFENYTKISGYLIQKSTGNRYNFPILSSSGRLTSLYQITSTNIVVRSNNESWSANNWDYEIILEYTKTTN